MTRSVPIWRGATDDAAIPKAVRLRVFTAHGGKCHLTGHLIRPGDVWHLDHVKPLVLGGTHSEDNLAPVLADAHKVKSAREVTAKSKADRIRLKHIGGWPKSKARIPSRPFQSTRAALAKAAGPVAEGE